MIDAHNITYRRGLGDWRLYLAVSLLVIASVPIQIFAVPGFEVTPALVLAPLGLLLFKSDEKFSLAVVFFMGFCGVLALIGMTGHEGLSRNLLGAASFSSGAPYLFVGMVLAHRFFTLERLCQLFIPSMILMVFVFIADICIGNGDLLKVSSYKSISYVSDESSFIDSFFPFYGKYAVITLATIAMLVGCLSLAAAQAFKKKIISIAVLLCSTTLIFIAFSLWTRQVMLGVVVFYIALMVLAFNKRETWISIAFFLVLLVPWASGVINESIASGDVVNATSFGKYKYFRALGNIQSGNLDDLSTGRMAIYREAIDKIDPEIFVAGCGFCNLKDVMGFQFSSLHNVFITAIYKGGIFYALIYCGAAFVSLILLWFLKRSFARDVVMSTVASIAFQGAVNDTLYFQVVPAILFSITGFCAVNYCVRRRSRLAVIHN
jgi:NADH:ubiquinone oxidoreductase subunit K